MARVKRGTAAHKRRKKTLKQTKGFMWGRKSKYRLAKEALIHARQYAYRDRKAKKRTMRASWQRQINAASRAQNVPYSRLAHLLRERNIQLDRKILARIAQDKPEMFRQIVEEAVPAK